MRVSVTLGLLVVALPAPGAADALHVFGPEGTPSERRALAVVELSDGGCASWDALSVSSPDGVSVEVGEGVGECARWLTITASPPRDRVELRVRGSAIDASAAIAMGSEHGLTVRVRRRQEALAVEVEGAPEGEPVRVLALWRDGQRELDAHGDEWRGEVPPGAFVGVVARSGGLTGAGASVPLGMRGPDVLVLPSDLAVPAGGAPRTAAFVLATDARGHLSRNVPLRVMSERGRLRAMTWLEPGVAAVRLSAPNEVQTVDVAVELGAASATRELPVVSGWPAHVELSTPVEIDAGPTDLRVVVRTLDGEALDEQRVVLRCGELTTIGTSARCDAPEHGGELLVVAAALIDGRAVPLATRRISVRPASRAPARAAPAIEPPAPAPRAAEDSRVALGVLIHGGLDTWARPSVGGGARVGVHLIGPFGVGARARYSATPFRASSSDARVGAIDGWRHSVELAAEAFVRGVVEGVGLVGWLGVGGGYVEENVTLDNVDLVGRAFVPLLEGSFGPSFIVDPRLAIDIALGVRVPLDYPSSVWPEAHARVFVEASLVVFP